MPVPYQEVAQETNRFMTGEAIAPYLANLPNYANMVGARSESTTQQLRGQLPDDVIRQIQQSAAERGISTGTSGSPNNNAAYLRALGLNSLQMQQQGSQNLTASIADTPVPQLFNPMSLYVPMTLANAGLAAAGAGRKAGAGGGVNQLSGSPNFPQRPIPPAYNVGAEQAALNARMAPSWAAADAARQAEDARAEAWQSANVSPESWWQQQSPSNQSPAWEQYGGSSADFGQFAQEDAYFQNMGGGTDYSSPSYDWTQQGGGTIDASDPSQAWMFE